MRILIITDDDFLSRKLATTLEKAEFEVGMDLGQLTYLGLHRDNTAHCNGDS